MNIKKFKLFKRINIQKSNLKNAYIIMFPPMVYISSPNNFYNICTCIILNYNVQFYYSTIVDHTIL